MTKTFDSAADQAEYDAYNKLYKRLMKPTAFVKPAGSKDRFPDFGFRIMVEGKPVDLHFEYKSDSRAQMGGMRDWVFDGRKFATKDTLNPVKEVLINIMNDTPASIAGGTRLLKDLQKYFDKRVTKLYSGTPTIEADRVKRLEKLEKFQMNTQSYVIANISNEQLGVQLIDNYKRKFEQSVRKSAAHSILFFVIGKELWFVDQLGDMPQALDHVANKLGITAIPEIKHLKANLEIRIQPKASLTFDTIANFRLSGKPSSGAIVI